MKEDSRETSKSDAISQELTNLLVSSILKKHGVTKDKVKSISADKKEELKDMVNKLKGNLEQLAKPVPITVPLEEKTQEKNTSKRRRRF